MSASRAVARRVLPVLVLLASLVGSAPVRASEVEGWVEIDYAELIDRRQPTHSGEPIGELLAGLEAVPPGSAPDRGVLGLLDPLLEPYAFVLQDTLDATAGPAEAPLVEVGGLWVPGQAAPAWVELLRARRYLVESDGRGRLRVCLPQEQSLDAPSTAEDAAEEVYRAAWPVLRLVFAAERRRLAVAAGSAELPALRVEVHPYRHSLARSRFRLGLRPLQVVVDDTRPAGRRPPFDLAALEAFLSDGLQLEGGRIEPDGSLRLLGSRDETAATFEGRPLEPADLAVAYRAVFRGGLAEPYMSLDRGLSPQTAVVNYGGRLRDTALGRISLHCDIRFKTFSVGLDVIDGQDLRATLRKGLPGFRTHYERFAAHPDSGSVLDQQTRLWFYPDNVDLTVSRQGDLLAMRRVRMSAASERFVTGTTRAAESDPPWTRATIDAINSDYDALAGLFPELRDLDGVVRLLSLFTWLRQAEADGLLLPELEALLDLELPAISTPRRFPQLLSFNVLPRGAGLVEVFDRLPVGEALVRLARGSRGPLPARRRLLRATAALDPQQARSKQLLEQLRGAPLDELADTRLDQLAYEAERVHMHQTVLGALAADDRSRLAERQQRGEELRVFSIGIGGLELGMDKVLDRAGGRRLGLGAGNGTAVAEPGAASTAGELARAARVTAEPREEWRRDPAGLEGSALPAHGWPTGREQGRVEHGEHVIERGGSGQDRWEMTLFGVDGVEATSRRVHFRDGVVDTIDRVGSSGLMQYRLEKSGSSWQARRIDTPVRPEWSPPLLPVEGLTVMQIGPPPPPTASTEPATVGLRLFVARPGGAEPRRLETEFPRAVLQRLLLGPWLDRTPDLPLPGLAPLPEALRGTETIMLGLNREQRVAPWVPGVAIAAGEEDPESLARALNVWWRERGSGPAAVAGTDPDRSAIRWSTAPRAGGGALLLLPAEAFRDSAAALRRGLADAWSGGTVADALPESIESGLVVLVSDEPSGLLGGRLRRVARSPAMQGKLLVVWPLSGPLRQDLPAALLAEERLAGLALGSATPVGRRGLLQGIERLGRLWTDGAHAGRRVESLELPLLWYF